MAQDGNATNTGTPWAPPVPSSVATTTPRRTLPPPSVDGPDIDPFAAPPSAVALSTPADQRDHESDALIPLLDTDGTAVIVVGCDGVVDAINEPMLALLGAGSREDLHRDSPARGVLHSFLDHLPRELLAGGAGSWSGDFDHRDADGGHGILRATVRVSPTDSDRRTIAMLLRDVSASRNRAATLHHQATHDHLTGLANRHRVMDELTQRIRRQRERPGHVAAIFVDLDHLKYVNDAFGHQVGDRLITSTATRLTQAIRPSDCVGRIGGDEFVVLSSEVSGPDDALELADRIRRALTGHLRIGELDLDFSVSVGIALTDAELFDLHDTGDGRLEHDDGGAAATLIGRADTAMYEAKKNGRGRCVLFTHEMRSAARERAEMAASLARSVGHHQLTVDYQPVFSAVTERAVGAEALVRWEHPTHGRMDPATFVAVAEESGLIGRLGEQVLDRAMTDLRVWIAEGTVDDHFSMHVNVSRLQLGSAAFVSTVMAKLREHRLAPHQLVLEARETSLLGRVDEVDRSIRALRRAGVQIAVDNFGTGPKALAVMTDVGADLLKLDGSLTLAHESSEAQTRLVRAVVLLAHALDMDVVAERVSGHDQLERLRAAGCDMVQGNLLGAPCAASEFAVVSSVVR